MKLLSKITVAVLACVTISSSGASGIGGVLDGMFANVTAPNVVSNQFRGSISGGGVYVRAPISNIQLFSIDPPRLSIGCGGIDLYLGAFSFITAEKLTQFIRNIAQNAAPLAFKMALDASFPQLGGALAEFRQMAQRMNDSQRNSCDIAHGMLDGTKDAGEVMGRLTTSVTAGLGVVKSWATDFSDAMNKATSAPSEITRKAQNSTNADNSPVLMKLGNVTWNVLNARKDLSLLNSVTDDPTMSQQILMTLIGTDLNHAGAADSDPPVSVPVPPTRLRLSDLFNPTIAASGFKEIPVWSCGNDVLKCPALTAGSFKTNGVDGFIRKKMYGNETAQEAQSGSIVYKMVNCKSGSCGMNSSQLSFLNALSKVPAVGMMMHAQGTPAIIGMIAPELISAMVTEVSILYGRSVLDIAITTYSNTDLPQPADFNQTIRFMMEDLRIAEQATKGNLARLNTMATYIDTATRAMGSTLRYRPH